MMHRPAGIALLVLLGTTACSGGDDDGASPADAATDASGAFDGTLDAAHDATADGGAQDGTIADDGAADAGAEDADAPFTGDAATCDAAIAPASGQPKGTITATGSFAGAPLPTADVRADTFRGEGGGIFLTTVTLYMTDYANACGYVASDIGKAFGYTDILLVSLQSPSAPPPDFAVGTYTAGADAGAYTTYFGIGRGSFGSACNRSIGVPPVTSGTITFTSMTASRIAGSFDVFYDSKELKGTFDAPICKYPTFLNYPSCCVN